MADQTFTYEIKCKDCGGVLGSVTFDNPLPQEEIDKLSQTYSCISRLNKTHLLPIPP